MPRKGHRGIGPARKGHITRKLEIAARKKHLGKEQSNRYVFGGLTNIKKRQRAKAARRRSR